MYNLWNRKPGACLTHISFNSIVVRCLRKHKIRNLALIATTMLTKFAFFKPLVLTSFILAIVPDLSGTIARIFHCTYYIIAIMSRKDYYSILWDFFCLNSTFLPGILDFIPPKPANNEYLNSPITVIVLYVLYTIQFRLLPRILPVIISILFCRCPCRIIHLVI